MAGFSGDPGAKQAFGGPLGHSLGATIETEEQIDEDEAIAADQQRVVAALVAAWASPGCLPDPAEPILVAQGTRVASPARWLTANLPRIKRLRGATAPACSGPTSAAPSAIRMGRT